MAGESDSAVRRLVGRGSIYTLCLAVQLSAGVIVVPILTRLLPAADYGRITIGLVVISCVQIFATGGLSEVAARSWFRKDEGPDHARRLALSTVPIALVVGVLFDVTGPWWAQILSLHYDATLRTAVWTGCAGECCSAHRRCSGRPIARGHFLRSPRSRARERRAWDSR